MPTRSAIRLLVSTLLTIQLLGCGGSDKESAHPEPSHSPVAEADSGHGDTSHGDSGHGESKSLGGLSQKVSDNLSEGKIEDALTQAEEALSQAREQDDKKLIVTSLHNLGKVHMVQGELEQSISLFEEALETGKELPESDRKMLALCFNKLASAYYAKRQARRARSALEQALESAHGEPGLEIQILQNLVKVCQQSGDTKATEHYLEMARVLTVKQGEPAPCQGLSLCWVSTVWPDRFYRPAAEVFLQRKFALNRESAPARYLARQFPSLEVEEEESGGGH